LRAAFAGDYAIVGPARTNVHGDKRSHRRAQLGMTARIRLEAGRLVGKIVIEF
jgi:hypothetical protein